MRVKKTDENVRTIRSRDVSLTSSSLTTAAPVTSSPVGGKKIGNSKVSNVTKGQTNVASSGISEDSIPSKNSIEDGNQQSSSADKIKKVKVVNKKNTKKAKIDKVGDGDDVKQNDAKGSKQDDEKTNENVEDEKSAEKVNKPSTTKTNKNDKKTTTKISKELRNLGIDFDKILTQNFDDKFNKSNASGSSNSQQNDGTSGSGGFTLASSISTMKLDESKTSICEMVKTKSRINVQSAYNRKGSDSGMSNSSSMAAALLEKEKLKDKEKKSEGKVVAKLKNDEDNIRGNDGDGKHGKTEVISEDGKDAGKKDENKTTRHDGNNTISDLSTKQLNKNSKGKKNLKSTNKNEDGASKNEPKQKKTKKNVAQIGENAIKTNTTTATSTSTEGIGNVIEPSTTNESPKEKPEIEENSGKTTTKMPSPPAKKMPSNQTGKKKKSPQNKDTGCGAKEITKSEKSMTNKMIKSKKILKKKLNQKVNVKEIELISSSSSSLVDEAKNSHNSSSTIITASEIIVEKEVNQNKSTEMSSIDADCTSRSDDNDEIQPQIKKELIEKQIVEEQQTTSTTTHSAATAKNLNDEKNNDETNKTELDITISDDVNDDDKNAIAIVKKNVNSKKNKPQAPVKSEQKKKEVSKTNDINKISPPPVATTTKRKYTNKKSLLKSTMKTIENSETKDNVVGGEEKKTDEDTPKNDVKDIYDFNESGNNSDSIEETDTSNKKLPLNPPIYKRKLSIKSKDEDKVKEEETKVEVEKEKVESQVKKSVKVVEKNVGKGSIKSKKIKVEPKEKEKKLKSGSESNDDTGDSESSSSIPLERIAKKSSKLAMKSRRMKYFGVWAGPKRHRMASLNALAKVQCLYENETRSSHDLGLSRPQPVLKEINVRLRTPTPSSTDDEKEEDDDDNEVKDIKPKPNTSKTKIKAIDINSTTRKLRDAPGIRGAGKLWEMDDLTSSDDNANDSDITYRGDSRQPKRKRKPKAEPQLKTPTKESKDISKQQIKTPKKFTSVKKLPPKPIKKQKPSSASENNASDASDDSDKKQKSAEPTIASIKKRKRNNSDTKNKKKSKDKDNDIKDVVLKKRMASLNASAILTATYEVERHLDRDLSQSSEDDINSEEEEGGVESIDEIPSSPVKIKDVKNENDSDETTKEVKYFISLLF